LKPAKVAERSDMGWYITGAICTAANEKRKHPTTREKQQYLLEPAVGVEPSARAGNG
jgi:hypothetical protein